jgi:hypothetical protein
MSRLVIAAVLALAAVLPAIPAQATSLTRTFVSSAGSDSNACTITQPCATFARAYSLTLANGIIAALDPGKYGPVTIMGPVTVNGYGWAAITGPASGNAITINANSTDKIALIGLEIDGAGAANNGIQFNTSGSLSVSDCVIRNFGTASGTAGIVYQPGASSTLSVSNTSVSDNFEGIDILPSGTGTTTAVLDNVKMERNANYGLLIQTSSQSINVTVSDSVVSSNQYGIVVSSPQVKSINVMVRNSIIANNLAGYGLWAVFDNAVIRVTRSTITGNNTAFFGDSGGTVASFGDNNIAANANTVSAPPKIGEQ